MTDSRASARKAVLMVDDDGELCRLVADYLAPFAFDVDFITDSSRALKQLQRKRYAAMIVDVMMPAPDGIELVRQIRQHAHALPVIMLTARGELTDKVIGLESGADDYLAKPFEPRELAARLAALTRRARALSDSATLDFADVRIHPARHEVEVRRDNAWQVAHLTDAEFRALLVLAQAAPEVVTRDTLSAQMRGLSFDVADRSMDITISRLRAKLGDDSRRPRLIRTVRNSGYAFIAAPE